MLSSKAISADDYIQIAEKEHFPTAPYQLDQIKAQILRYLVLNYELEDNTPECWLYCKDATAVINRVDLAEGLSSEHCQRTV